MLRELSFKRNCVLRRCEVKHEKKLSTTRSCDSTDKQIQRAIFRALALRQSESTTDWAWFRVIKNWRRV